MDFVVNAGKPTSPTNPTSKAKTVLFVGENPQKPLETSKFSTSMLKSQEALDQAFLRTIVAPNCRKPYLKGVGALKKGLPVDAKQVHSNYQHGASWLWAL